MAQMIPLGARLPDLAERETRTAHVRGKPSLPDGDYGFIELFCDDPKCDCRRAIIWVVCPRLGRDILATLNYGWESLDFYARWVGDRKLADGMAGVTLEPFGRQSKHASELKRLFEYVLEDPEYAARIQRHYQAFKADLRRGRTRRAWPPGRPRRR